MYTEVVYSSAAASISLFTYNGMSIKSTSHNVQTKN